MGKGNLKKAKEKTSKDLCSPNKVHGGTMVKAKMHKAIKSGLTSNGSLQHIAEVKNIPKNSMKKKRKRSLVSADDPAFADCFSDTEDTLKNEWNDSSLNDVVKTIMSEGGSLQPNGALLRPGKAVKRKCKTKDVVKSSNNEVKVKKNYTASHDKMKLNIPCKTSAECSHEKEISTGCTANVDCHSENSLQTLSPVQKKQKKDTCRLSVTKTNSEYEKIELVMGKECNTDGKIMKNDSPSEELQKKKKKASNHCNGDGVVSKVKNGSVSNTTVGNSNDEHTRKISTPISSVQTPIKKKNKKEIDASIREVSEQNNKANETVDNSCDLTPAIINSAEIIGASEASDASSNSHLFINESYSSKSFCKKLRRLWRGKDVEDLPEGSTVLHVPFNCAHLANFTSSDSNFLDRLKQELRSLPFTFQNNDIFKFHQSGELPLSGACLELRQLLTGPVRDWLISITQIPLAESVDLSASLYLHSDALLCHDDELEGRRIAFILYLTDEHDTWQPSDGGSLDLFDGEPGLAGSMVQRLYPHLNTFAFFEVSPRSFHQVSEVLSRTKARLSVSGWFHGPPIDYPPRPIRPPKLFSPPAHVEEKVFFSWISPVYLAESLQCSIRRQLAQDSEIQLENFFAPEKFEALSDALRCVDTWHWAGPPTSAHYEVCGTAVPDVVREFLLVMRSEAFFLVLAQLTGVALHRLASPDEGGSSSDGDSDGSDLDEEEADCKTEDPKLRTLKRILKDHKKKGGSSDGEELRSNVSVGLDEKWSYDLGLPLLGSSACSSSSDLTATSVSDDATPNKTEAKKLKKAKLEHSKSVKSKEQLGTNSNTVSGNVDVGTCASALCSIRRLSHGCYSLIRDDDNNDGGNMGGQCGAELKMQGKELDRAATASKVTGGDGCGSAGEKESMDSEATGKKSKKRNMNGTDHEKETKRKRPEHENDEESESDDGSYILDVSLFCNVPEDWSESYGGYTAYVGQHDQEQLLSVMPCNNSLALVYRDHRTHSFIKHINATAGAATFHQIFCQYRER